jgi:amidohydrolase
MTPTQTILDHARALQEKMVAWRRDFHQHPELSFQEVRTANVVAQELCALGLEVETGVGGTGVVARIGEGGPVVAIRADMDALPIHEETGLAFASQTPNVMHACGHDAHTAILLGVAHILTRLPERPVGEIRLLFQPAEETQDDEGQSGATYMIKAGALKGVDYTLSLHVASPYPAGAVYISEGYVSANVDSFEATIFGKGCHGASPHLGIDPIFITAQIINAIYGIRARRVDPTLPAIISIGALKAGEADNVVPDSVYLNGTIRSYAPDVREQLRRDLEAALSLARALGGDYELKLMAGYPSMYNDATVTQTIRQATQALFGENAVRPFAPMMGGEDFAYMQQAAPGAMFMLGAKIGEENLPHHSPRFDIDETYFYQGAAVLAETALRLLTQKHEAGAS